MGAGSASAQIQFLEARMKRGGGSSVPRLRPVSYKIPEGHASRIRKMEQQYPDLFEYVEGKQTPTSLRKMEQADLITDEVGIGEYAETMGVSIDKIISAYIDILKPGGVLLMSTINGLDWSDIPRNKLKLIEEQQFLTSRSNSNFIMITKRKD